MKPFRTLRKTIKNKVSIQPYLIRPFLTLFLIFIALNYELQAQEVQVWPVDSLNTARNVDYLSPIEKEIIFEINKVRYNPKLYAENFILSLKPYYNGKKFILPGEVPILTEEGIVALESCLNDLRNAQPAPPLFPSKGITKASKLLVYDQSLSGRVGHEGSGNTSPFDRMMLFGTISGKASENIQYGMKRAVEIVAALLIDDGVKSRGHRKTIIDPEFKLVGVSTGSHKTFSTMSVIDFANGFKEKAQ